MPENIQTEIIYALKNPKKNPKIVSKLPIPVYRIALLIPLLIIKTKKIIIINIVTPRPTSNTYSLSIISVRYTGIGSLDTIFGFFFGFLRAYIISVCIFSGVHIVYNYDKWPINIDKSYVFPYLEKGSNYLLKEFPDEKTYQDSKEKIEEL